MAFNPDAYLKSLEQAPVDTFDPDAYLKSLEPPKAEESSFIRRALGDTAVGLGQGVVSAGQAAVGIADIPTFGAAGKALSAIGYDPQRTNQILQELKSPEEQAIEKKIAETKGFLPTAKEIITHPTALLDFGLQSAPSMVGGAGIARKILTTADKMLAKKLGLSLEEYATKKAAETAASTVAAEAATQRAILAGAAGEGAVSAGSTAEQIREQNPSGYLTPAQVAISTVSGALTGTLGVFGGKLANKLGIGDIDTILAGGARTAAQTVVKKNIFLKAAEGALSESVFEELPQSMQEQISQNLATGKPWDQGVAEAGAQGAMAAIGMGGIGGGVSQYSANKQIEKNAQAQPAIETPAVPLIEAQAGTVPPVVTPAGVPPVVNPVLTDADVEDLQAEQPVAPVTPTPVATAPTATPIPQAVQPTAIPAVPPVALDAARIQELKNSIAEGEMIAKSGKKTDGTKMSKGELGAVNRSIENAKIKLNELESVNAPVATAPVEQVLPIETAIPPVVKIPATTNEAEQKAALDAMKALPVGGMIEMNGAIYKKNDKSGYDIVSATTTPPPVSTTPVSATPVETAAPAVIPTEVVAPTPVEAVTEAPVEKPKTQAQKNQERQQEKKINAIDAKAIPLDAYYNGILTAMANSNKSEMPDVYGDDAPKAIEILKNNNLVAEDKDGKLSLLPAGQSLLTDIRNYNPKNSQEAVSTQDALFAKHIKQLQAPTTPVAPKAELNTAKEWNDSIKVLQDISDFPNVKYEDLEPSLQKRIAEVHSVDGKLGPKNMAQFTPEIEKHLTVKANKDRIAEQKRKAKNKSNTLLTKLIDLGGVSTKDKRDVTGEKQSFPPGYARAFRADAKTSLRGHIERGDLDEFLPNNMRLSANTMAQGAFDSEPAYDYLSNLIKNGKSVTPYIEAEKEASEFERYAGTETMLSDSEGDALDDLVKWATEGGIDLEAIRQSLVGENNAQKERNLLRMLQEARDEEQSNAEPIETTKGPAGPDIKTGIQETAGELKLTGQTEAEIKADEAKAKANAEAKAKEEAQAEQKRKAEKETFTLTGSDREADIAGAKDLFAQPEPKKLSEQQKITPKNLGAKVTPQVLSNAEKFIKIAADSVKELRKQDVERVLNETPAHYRSGMASYIKENRKDLIDEVNDIQNEAPKAKTEAEIEADEEAAYEALQEQAETEIDEGPIGQALLKIEDGDFETKAQVRSFINKLEKDGILEDVEDAREGLSDREQTAEDVLDTVRGLLDDARDDAVQERVDELESEQRITAPTKDEEVAEEVARSFTSYVEGERKVAEDTAKRFGGEIVWQDGDLALIRGYGILNGKPVYVFSKDGTTPRVDIESYTGSHINLTQLNNLIAIKTKLEAEANKKHKETPFVKFDDGIAMSKDIPVEVAGITKEWKKMLGIKANIYVSSIEDAKENRNNFTGPMRAIGAGTLNANERGSMLKLPDGSYFVLFTKSTSKTRMLETIAHELGHVHEKEVYESQTMDVKFAIKQQYDQWLQSNKGKTAREHIVGMRSKTTAQTTVIGESFKESKELPAYWSRFSEWYADQTARWAISSEKPVSVVDTYFARLGKALRKFYNTLKGQGFLPNETFKKYLDGIAERTEALQEQTETEAVKEKPFTEVNKPSKIEDFGEKIFVKKDAWINFKNKVDESKEVDIETSPLSKSWVEPDYQKLLDEGMSPFGVAFLHSTRDAVPTKPKATWKLRSWVKKVNTLRDLSYGFIDGNITEEQIKEIINKEDEYSNYNYLKNRIDLYLAAGHEKSLKGYELSKHSWTYYKGMKYDPPGVILWEVRSANGTQISESENKEEAIAKFVNEINKPKGEIERKEIKFGVWSRRGKEGFFIGKKIGKNVIYLKMLPTVKEARDYILNNHDELVAQFEKYKEIPSERGEINQVRVGADHRMGANVSQEQFFDTFGFRSTIFGNTVNNARRQQDLNNAYDALMDLAGVLEIPPKALSMNGEIGLLFGADGRGGKNPASAHYSNSKLAINLTKTNGAGSLAHELFHALDNYFSRMGGDKYKMLTETQKASANVRPEVVAAFKDLMTAISATSIKERSKNLDKRRTKEYWSTGLEMAARAFESYVINKLKDQNASNDYLANIVSEKEFNIEDGYPYPTAAEIPAIRAAFDNFFNVLETKETDKGVMLYNIDTKVQTKTPAFKKWFGNSKIVDANGNPLVVYHGTKGNFTEFKFSRDVGFHFGTKWQARDITNDTGILMPVYLQINNPVLMDDVFSQRNGWSFVNELKDKGILSKEEYQDVLDNNVSARFIEAGILKLKQKGYDGIIYNNKVEGILGKDNNSYIAFSPNQIKSAIGNKGTFDETDNILQNQQFVKDGIAYESEEDYRDRQIQELRVASMKVGKAVKHIADYGSNLPLQRKLNQLLEREASLKDYLESTKPENNSDADFMARATKELAAGNISEEVEAVIRQIYEKYPGVLSGLKLSVKQNKHSTSSAAGAFNPYARIVSLYKDTSGVEDPSTVRHELVHSLEQMMTPQAAQAVVNAWARAFEKAMKKNIDPASKAYFDAVLEFLASPSKESFEKATNLMPSYDFYQYLNPSEYWAVNAESMLQAKLGTPWNRFVLGVKRLIEGLKSVLGFDNTYVVHNALNNLLKTTPQRLSKNSLVDYVTKGKVKIDFLNNIDDERRLMDNLGVPNVPSHIPKTLREKIGETHKSTEELVGEIKRGPNNVLKAAGLAVGDAITEARIQAINFNAGLERADAKKYAGKIRDANNNMLPSIAVKNATHANSVYNAVLHQGKMRYDEKLGAFTAYDSDESLKNIVELQHKLRKKTGVELGDKVINSWFAAKRTKGIQDNYLNLMKEINSLQEELLLEDDPEVIAQLTADLNAAQHWLDALEAAFINVPSFLVRVNPAKPTKVVDGKTIPNIIYDRDGMPVLNDDAIDEIIALEDKYPELKEMMKNWKGVSHNMIDNMAFSSRISQKEADGLKEIKDYSPWQRIRDEEEEGLFGNRSTGATSGIARFRKTRTELPLENVIENMTNQVKRMVKSSLINFANNRIAMEYAVRKDPVIDKKTGLPKVDKTTGLPAKGKIKVFPKEREGRSSEGVVFPIYVNGNRIHIQIEDSQIADALLGLAMGPVNVPFQAALSGFSNLVRRSITFSGYFQTKQVFYDAPTAAWVSGVKSPFKVWVKSFSTYAKALGSIVTGVDAPTIKILKAAGVGGYHTFHRESLAEEQTTLEAISGKGFARFKRMVDRIGDASDYAQRGAIYDQVLAETGDPSLALLKASDIVDWNKRGLHDAAQGLRQTVPFLGAYAIQLDAFSQAAIAGGTISSAKAGKEVTRRQALMQFYLKTGLGMALLVAAYTLAAGSDDDYWKLDDDTRARNFYVPGSKKAFGNPILIPMHSTAALFWKVIPESMLSYVLSQGTKNEIDASRARSALWRATKDSVLGPMPIPAAIKTPAEIAINYDFFTGTNVVPQSLAKLDASEQYNYNTSELGKALSVATTIPFTGNKDKQGNRQGEKRVLNPIEADHLIRGWLGSVGSISEWVSNQLFGEHRPASELRSNPLVGGIVGPETSRRNEALFYDLKDKTEPAYNTYIKLIKENKASEVKNFYDANRNLIEAYGYTSKMDSKLQELNSYMKFVGKIEDKSWTKDKKLAEILRMQKLKSDILEGTLYFRKRAGL